MKKGRQQLRKRGKVLQKSKAGKILKRLRRGGGGGGEGYSSKDCLLNSLFHGLSLTLIDFR